MKMLIVACLMPFWMSALTYSQQDSTALDSLLLKQIEQQLQPTSAQPQVPLRYVLPGSSSGPLVFPVLMLVLILVFFTVFLLRANFLVGFFPMFFFSSIL